MSKINNKKTQEGHEVSEPVMAYGSEKHDMTPEELYSVIADDVKAIYAYGSN